MELSITTIALVLEAAGIVLAVGITVGIVRAQIRELRTEVADLRKWRETVHEERSREVAEKLSELIGAVNDLREDVRRLTNAAWPESRNGT